MTTSTVARQQQSARAAGRPSDRSVPDWLARVLGSDPGQARLLTALQTVATVGAAMAAELLFVKWTHALQIPRPAGPLSAAVEAQIDAQHHGVLVIAILLGAIVGMIASFTGSLFPQPRTQLATFALMPIPMIAGLCVGLSLAPYRSLALASFVIVLAAGAYCRRFGPHGFVGGMLVFMGDFFGFFLHGEVGIRDVGWLAAEIGVGSIVAIVAQFTLFFPSRRLALNRMRRSYTVRAREVGATALDIFDGVIEGERASRRLNRRLVRLNEAALLIDAQLGAPGALPPSWSPTGFHQRLFDAELALTNIARFAERLSQLRLPAPTQAAVRSGLAAVAAFDMAAVERAGQELIRRVSPDAIEDAGAERVTQVVLHRFATSLLGLDEAVRPQVSPAPGERAVGDEGAPADADESFESPVVLIGGWLPGSVLASAAASLEPDPGAHADGGLWRRLRFGDGVALAPSSRIAIQLAVAVTAAILIGQILSERRFYWAVIATFVTFMGAHNAGEQLRKGSLRLIGTLVGVVIGALLAHAVGDRTDLAIAVILVSLFLGIYLMRVSYAFMVVGITIMVSQLYVQLDEFSNSLLVLRLEETAIGAGVAALTIIVVLPLRTGRVVRVAVRQYLAALTDVATGAIELLSVPARAGRATPHESEVAVRAAARRMDAAYQTLEAVTAPLRGALGSHRGAVVTPIRQHVAASRHYARNLLIDSASADVFGREATARMHIAGSQLSASIESLVASLRDGEPEKQVYVRSAALFDVATAALPDSHYTSPEQLVIRDLQMIDGALASLAEYGGMQVRALDGAGSLTSAVADDRRVPAPAAGGRPGSAMVTERLT